MKKEDDYKYGYETIKLLKTKKEDDYKYGYETIKLLKTKKDEKISKLISDINLEYTEYEKQLNDIDNMLDVCVDNNTKKLIEEKYITIIEKIRKTL